MSYVERKCISLSCDGCQGEFDHDYTPHFDSKFEADEYVRETDGRVVDGTHWCLSCVEEGRDQEPKEPTT